MIRGFAKLVRPRLSLLNGVTAAAGYLLFPAPVAALPLAAVTVGVTLLAAGASAFNQVMERDLDALMARTGQRPLPRGDMSPGEASFAGCCFTLAGSLSLGLSGGIPPVLLGLAALAWYLGVYTPLKRRTTLALPLGAICGALPPVIGWSLAGGSPGDYRIILMAGFLYLWQMPHFWLILRRYEDEYRAAGIPLAGISREAGNDGLFRLWLAALIVGTMLLPVCAIVDRGIPHWYPLTMVPLLLLWHPRHAPSLGRYLTLYPLLVILSLII